MITKCTKGTISSRTLSGLALAMALLTTVVSCKTEEIAVEESAKQIHGSWRIAEATRNGTDITDKFDFSTFTITFQEDGTYQLGQPLPFIVSRNGTYTLDDPQYPFQIKFEQEIGDGAVSSDFDYPIVEGKRNLSLTFSSGCASNTYRYTLVRE